MKKFYASFIMMLLCFASHAQFPSPYCAEAFASGVEPITNVTFAGINNSSSATLGGTAHENFTAITGSVQQGSSYVIEVQGNTGGNYTNTFRLFVDWNNDNDFLDAGESYDIGTILNSTGTDGKKASSTIAVPAGATIGNLRMRVSKKFSTYAPACNTTGYGQAEDYTLVVSAGSPCTGTPNGGAITPANTTLCSAGSVTLTSNAANAGTGFTYQWQSSPAGANTFTTVSTSASYTGNVSSSTDFRLIITCSASGLSATSSIATVTVSSAPSNDAVCDAMPLTLNGAEHCGNTTCATSTGDPTFAQSTPNNTVWYTYTPTTNGPVQAKFKRPAGLTSGFLNGWLGVYTATGACPSLTLTEVSGNALGYNLTTADSVLVTTSSLTAGTTYYLMVDGNSGAFGAYCIQLQTPPPPPACSQLLLPTNGNTSTDNLFTLTWNKSALATSYDVYIGTTSPPAFFTNVVDTVLQLSSNAGNTTFYWYIVPKNSGGAATGCNSTIFSFTTRATPINDSCGAANTLVGGSMNGEITGATPSPASAVTCGASSITPANDVWFKMTALSNGNATVTVFANFGSGFNPVIAAYSGTCSSPVFMSCSDASATTSETISLTGLVAGNTYLLRVFANGTVTNGGFTISAAGAALPVTGVTLTVTRNGSRTQLSWQTVTEVNNAGFELERSADGRTFTGIAKVASKAIGGNSTSAINYAIEDVRPLSGANYYRLKQTDLDGKSSFSNVVYLKGSPVASVTLSALYPNPAKDLLKAAIQSPGSENITFVITDMMGKVIRRQVNRIASGDSIIDININNLPAGTYLVKAVCLNGCESAYKTFTKQ